MTIMSSELRCASGSALKASKAGKEPTDPVTTEAGMNPIMDIT